MASMMEPIFNFIEQNNQTRYFSVLGLVLFAYIFSPIIAKIIIKINHIIFNIDRKTNDSAFYGPLKFYIILCSFAFSIKFLHLTTGMVNLFWKLFKILTIMTIAKALGNAMAPESTFFDKLEKNTKFKGNHALNQFVGTVFKGLIYIVAGFMILSDLGYNMGGLVTGLGLGSAVVALAAQDFVKSLIGGMQIVADKPFNIGDYIEVGNYAGTVTKITYRSTRIKATNNAIISVPNSVIVTEYVKNWSKLENRRIEIELRLDLNTSKETVQKVVTKLRTMLKADEDVLEDTVIVFLDKITQDSNLIWIALYIDTKEYVEYLRIKERINCNILELLEKENVELVYPTQKIYTKNI